MITAGIGTYGHDTIQVRGEMNNIIIGKWCSISQNVVMDGGFNHSLKFASTYPFFNRFGIGEQNIICKGDIVIGNGVLISEDVLIMSGVTIGDGAVIGAKTIVTKDVPPYCVVAGCPAKPIKWVYQAEHIRDLMKIMWWEWSEEKVLQELPFATDIQEFINKHKV